MRQFYQIAARLIPLTQDFSQSKNEGRCDVASLDGVAKWKSLSMAEPNGDSSSAFNTVQEPDRDSVGAPRAPRSVQPSTEPETASHWEQSRGLRHTATATPHHAGFVSTELTSTQPGLLATTLVAPTRPAAVTTRTIGPYVLIDRLGGGGQGDVWKARQFEPFSRLVALKLLSRECALDEQRVDRLRKEAERGGRLCDQAILPIYDFGEIDGHAFIAMQLVDGPSLAGVIAQRRAIAMGLNPSPAHPLARRSDQEFLPVAVSLIARVARGLHAAHSNQIAHRDVKPSNILLDGSRDDMVFLSDFGLARDLSDVTDATLQGVPGTPIYMAPEKLAGRPRVDEIRADVYALGVTLFEATTLKRPFEVPTDLPRSSWPSYLVNAEPRRPRALAPSLPRDLEAIILKSTDRNPSRRYATAAEFAEDLERFLAGEHVRARPPSAFRRAWRNIARRRSVRISALSLLVVTPLVSAGVIAWEAMRNVNRLDTAEVLFQQGRTTESLVEIARGLQANRENLRALELLGRLETKVSADARDNVDELREWVAHRERIQSRYPALSSLPNAIGSRTIAIATQPPGMCVLLHALKFDPIDGEPRASGPVLHSVHGGRVSHPERITGVVDGMYWLTCYDPATGAFVERPLRVANDTAGRLAKLLIPLNQTATPPMIEVPGGILTMGHDRPKAATYAPAHPVRVATFLLSPLEVTNGEFFEFLQAQSASDPHWEESAQRIWPHSGEPDAGRVDWPVTNVTYEEAVEYAAWRGGRLPTGAELEWAARGQSAVLEPTELPADWKDNRSLWYDLHAIGTNPQDRTRSPNGVLFDLFANAGEMTLSRFRLPPGHPQWEYLREERFAKGFVVRCGLILNQATSARRNLGYLDRASQLGGARNPFVGLRLARSLRPWVDPAPAASTLTSE
jgi:serine/threonine-protein kinase